MKSTFLIQRLKARPKNEFHAAVTRAFGGGMVGMPDEGWKVLQEICDLDLMGAAEFEWGVVPKALAALVDDREKLGTFSVTVPRALIKPNWRREQQRWEARQKELAAAKAAGVKAKRMKKLPPIRGDDPVVYVICRREHWSEVAQRIVQLAGDKLDLLKGTHFPSALDPMEEWEKKTVGWLELDNGYLFFTGHEEYAGMAKLFGLEPLPLSKTTEVAGEAPSVPVNEERTHRAEGEGTK